MHSQYDLVRVKLEDGENLELEDFDGAIGIIEEVDQDIDGDACYILLFAGRYHNDISRKIGIPIFYDDELEGI